MGAEQDVLQWQVKNKGDNDTTAAFLEFNFDLSDSLTFDIGGRWSEDN